MKAEFLSFDEVLDSIKMGDIENIYVITILSGFVKKLEDVEVFSLVRERKDSVFIQVELEEPE